MTGEHPSTIDPAHDPRFDEDGSLVKPKGPLKNTKREAYCRYRVEGWDSVKAYYEAGYKPGSKVQASKDAARMEGRPDIKARIFELKVGREDYVDDAQEAREDSTINSSYINTQMKLLLIQAKHENSLKLAKDIIEMMGKTIGMFDEKDPTHVPESKALANSANTGGAVNIKELTQVFNNNSGGNGSVDKVKPALEGEYTPDTHEDGDNKSQ